MPSMARCCQDKSVGCVTADLRKVNPSRFAGGFSKTPWTGPCALPALRDTPRVHASRPWGLSHKIPLVRVSESLLRSALVAFSASFLRSEEHTSELQSRGHLVS